MLQTFHIDICCPKKNKKNEEEKFYYQYVDKTNCPVPNIECYFNLTISYPNYVFITLDLCTHIFIIYCIINFRKKEKPFLENLASLLETHLPGPPDVLKRDQQVECGICYAQNLPIGNAIQMYLYVIKHYILLTL